MFSLKTSSKDGKRFEYRDDVYPIHYFSFKIQKTRTQSFDLQFHSDFKLCKTKYLYFRFQSRVFLFKNYFFTLLRIRCKVFPKCFSILQFTLFCVLSIMLLKYTMIKESLFKSFHFRQTCFFIGETGVKSFLLPAKVQKLKIENITQN